VYYQPQLDLLGILRTAHPGRVFWVQSPQVMQSSTADSALSRGVTEKETCHVQSFAVPRARNPSYGADACPAGTLLTEVPRP